MTQVRAGLVAWNVTAHSCAAAGKTLAVEAWW